MKPTTVIALAALAAFAGEVRAADSAAIERTCASMASYRAFDVERFESRLLTSLSHEVDGVVESAIREVTLLRLAQPTKDSKRIARKLESLAARGATPAIRFKAQLAGFVYENPSWFACEGCVEYTTDDQVFTAVLSRLRESLLATGQ